MSWWKPKPMYSYDEWILVEDMLPPDDQWVEVMGLKIVSSYPQVLQIRTGLAKFDRHTKWTSFNADFEAFYAWRRESEYTFNLHEYLTKKYIK